MKESARSTAGRRKGSGRDLLVVGEVALAEMLLIGAGLLLVPTGRQPVADVVAIPDCANTPEQLVGLTPGVPAESQFARRLAESGRSTRGMRSGSGPWALGSGAVEVQA